MGTGDGDHVDADSSDRTTISFRFRKLITWVFSEYPHEKCRDFPENNLEKVALDMIPMLQWVWDNHTEKAKRNFLAHIGGHLADWTYTEMLERAGQRCVYRVVYNGQYQYLLGKIKQEITHIMRDKPEQLRIFNEVTDFFSSDVAIGDIFESYIAMKFFNNEAEKV